MQKFKATTSQGLIHKQSKYIIFCQPWIRITFSMVHLFQNGFLQIIGKRIAKLLKHQSVKFREVTFGPIIVWWPTVYTSQIISSIIPLYHRHDFVLIANFKIFFKWNFYVFELVQHFQFHHITLNTNNRLTTKTVDWLNATPCNN